MGIWAILLDENGEQIGAWNSKAVFAFCAEALDTYCRRGEMSRYDRESNAEILEWFPQITKAMSKPLCLLNQAVQDPWEYNEDEYERYLLDLQLILSAFPAATPMTPSEFSAMCADPTDPFLETNLMAEIVQDLLIALKKLRPPETWWYNEADSWPQFEQLLTALKDAQKGGIQKVRFGYG